MTDTDGEFVAYRVVEQMLGRHQPSGKERVLITAIDDAGDPITWSAQPDRAPRIGTLIEVNMRPAAPAPQPAEENRQ